jgi:tRNA A-37 threonylcarbamoyl transferase component Bud32
VVRGGAATAPRTPGQAPQALPPAGPPGWTPLGDGAAPEEAEGFTDWTLNTPAIKVVPASLQDFPEPVRRDPDRDYPSGEWNMPSPPGVAPAPRPELPRHGYQTPTQPVQAPPPALISPTATPAAASQAAEGAAADSTREGPDPHLGTTLGERYVLDDIIGEGGMGRVYLAHHKVIGKRLAIKILHAELVKDKEAVGRFLREARAASSIGNPHIVDIADFGEMPDGSTYFVMEYLDGHTLGDLMDEGRALPVDLVAEVALQLCDGLAAAHAQQIVHRDLKPENVTLIKQGSQPNFVKILDFGIAKVSTAQSSERLTMAGAVFGTPHYMSPEQAAGAAVDHRTDIYSLGVILYEMASGELPFNADNFMGILTQHMYKAPVPIRALVPAPDCPPGLEAIILKCLSKKPDARYQSMEALASDLRQLRAGQIPDAVHEMMARSGSFNVPADYFKTAGPLVAPTPKGQRRHLGPRYAWIAAAVVCVAVALLVVFRDSIGTAQQRLNDGPEGSWSAATGDASASSSAEARPSRTAERAVLLGADPITAKAWRDGLPIELPASITVAEGQPVTLEIRAEGYEPQTVVLTGEEERKSVKLDKKAAGGRLPGGRTKTKTAPAASGGKHGDTVDPWATGGKR